MNSDSVNKRLKAVLVKQLNLERDPSGIRDDEALFREGLNLDSIDLLEIIVAVEREFGIAITDDDLKEPEKIFRSIGALSDFIQSRIK